MKENINAAAHGNSLMAYSLDGRAIDGGTKVLNLQVDAIKGTCCTASEEAQEREVKERSLPPTGGSLIYGLRCMRCSASSIMDQESSSF